MRIQGDANLRKGVTRRPFVVVGLVVSVCAVIAVSLTTPCEARAGCGEYVLINGRPASLYHPPVVAHLPILPANLPGGNRPDTRLPCDGPHCGKQIPLPVPADPPTVQVRGLEQWASLLGVRETAEVGWSASYRLEQCSWQEVYLPRLDRPPRV